MFLINMISMSVLNAFDRDFVDPVMYVARTLPLSIENPKVELSLDDLLKKELKSFYPSLYWKEIDEIWNEAFQLLKEQRFNSEVKYSDVFNVASKLGEITQQFRDNFKEEDKTRVDAVSLDELQSRISRSKDFRLNMIAMTKEHFQKLTEKSPNSLADLLYQLFEEELRTAPPPAVKS